MAPIQGTLDAKSLFNGEWFGCTPPLAAVLLAKLPFQRLVCHRVLDSCSGGVERATAVEHGGGFPPPSFATLYAVAATIINPSSFASQFVAKLKCLAVTMVVSTPDSPPSDSRCTCAIDPPQKLATSAAGKPFVQSRL